MLSILICKFWSNFCSSFYEILLTMLKTMVCGVSTLNKVSFSMKYISSSWMFAIFFFLLFSLLYGHRVTVIYYSLFYSASGKTTKFGLSVDNLFQKYANKLLGMIEWVPFSIAYLLFLCFFSWTLWLRVYIEQLYKLFSQVFLL